MSKFKSKIKNDDFFVVRSPRLPITELFNLDTEPSQLRAQLKTWVERPEVKDALYLASPSLLSRLPKWLKDPASKQGKKIEQALLKYMIRMTSRPTPFGLFSGVCIGKTGSKSEFISADLSQDSSKSRLDLEYLNSVKAHATKGSNLGHLLKYFLNPSIYYVGEECRYIEPYSSANSNQYRLSAITLDECSKTIFEICSTDRTIVEISNKFSTIFPDFKRQEINLYIQQLIDEAVLLPKISLPLTGKSPDVALLRSLEKIEENQVTEMLENAIGSLRALDAEKTQMVDSYKKIYISLKELPIEVKENKLFQVDIYRKYLANTLSNELLESLNEKLAILARLNYRKEQPLQEFVRIFNERYEGQFVELSKILDEESGISISSETGYEAPFIAGLKLSRKHSASNDFQTPITPLERVISQELGASQKNADGCLRLSSSELLKHAGNVDIEEHLPCSFATMISLYKEKNEDIIHLKGAYGPSAANLLGRFCHLNDSLKNKVREHLKMEQDHSSTVVFAEIAHSPEGRAGNVIARPHLRDYEIVFMADSTMPKDFQISVDDLFVFIEGGEVKLWSKRLDKRVVTRLSSAHNYSSRSLSLYKFLCMLQKQEGSYPLPTLKSVFGDSVFIPRIMLDNLVLSEKAWRVPRKKLSMLLNSKEDYQNKLQAFLKEFEMDRHVSFSVGDNVLVIDLENLSMVEILLAETKNYVTLLLKEVLASSYEPAIKSEDGKGNFTNEIIIPYNNPAARILETRVENPMSKIDIPDHSRRFIPGSEWMSIKVYSGNSALEDLLRDKIFPLVQKHTQLNTIGKWFFIRYSDPEYHLRLRFRGAPQELYTTLLPEINKILQPLLDSNELHKVELFTYQRETERYGGEHCIDLVESLFSYDSNLVSNSLILTKEFDESVRWRINLLKADRLLNLFGYQSEAKLDLISWLRAGFGAEFNETSVLRKQLGNQYKKFKEDIVMDFQWVNSTRSSDLGGSLESEVERDSILAAVEQWEKSAAPTIKLILEQYRLSSGNTCSIDSLLSSILHMHTNRIFKAYGREHEFVIYDFLRRYYFSSRQIVRKNKKMLINAKSSKQN